jgi:hypothetical protein
MVALWQCASRSLVSRLRSARVASAARAGALGLVPAGNRQAGSVSCASAAIRDFDGFSLFGQLVDFGPEGVEIEDEALATGDLVLTLARREGDGVATAL